MAFAAALLSGCDQSPNQAVNSADIKPEASAKAIQTAANRWYSAAQVKNGYQLYQDNCAVCHKADAAGTKNWSKPISDGKYPPPPLNGSAHTWHHPLRILRRVIKEGGIKLGGTMPGFENRLTAQQIDEILAWVQSNWTDEIYQIWLDRDGLK